MRKILIMLILFSAPCVFAEGTEMQQKFAQNSLTVSQHIMFENCTKIFGVNQEKLFYLTLASISANRFNIDEIQSENGYIIFSANRNKYLATIARVDKTNAILKIVPCNNVYNFPPGIIINTFKYIDINLAAKV